MPTVKHEPSPKRRKLDSILPKEELAAPEHHNQNALHKGLDRPISPPSRRKDQVASNTVIVPTWGFEDVPQPSTTSDVQPKKPQEIDGSTHYVPSPTQLTHIEDMAPHQNVDAVRLKDILGDPMIKECWNFNFLFDIDFVM
jgi:tyrosyl-DNA phosphodiesterase-1